MEGKRYRLLDEEGKAVIVKKDKDRYIGLDELAQHIAMNIVDDYQSILDGDKKIEAYHDRSIRSLVYSDIYCQLKREYGCVSSYKSIKRKYIADVHEFIDCYVAPVFLREQIADANAQMSFAK